MYQHSWTVDIPNILLHQHHILAYPLCVKTQKSLPEAASQKFKIKTVFYCVYFCFDLYVSNPYLNGCFIF